MSAIRTTIGGHRDVQVIPYLHPREVDYILDAIDAGDLVAIADSAGCTPGGGSIVVLAEPVMAEKIAKRDDENLEALRDALARAERELSSLVTIIGEVFAENEPGDYRWRVQDAAHDVRKELGDAVAVAEEM